MPNYADGHVVTSSEFNSLVPVGMILPFGGTVAPSGWLVCDGSAVSRTTYADLFAAIGTTHGSGDGSTTFNLPDLRTRIIAGYKSGDANFGTVGGTGGEATHTLVASEMPSHTHTYDDPATPTAVVGTSGGQNLGDKVPSKTAGTATGSAGSGGAHNNLQPYMALLHCIRY